MTDMELIAFAAGFTAGAVLALVIGFIVPLIGEWWYRRRTNQIIATWRKKVYGEDVNP